MQIHKNEITTGILVLVTFGVLIAVLVVIGMPGVIKPLNTYRIYYDNANGIRPGAPVLLAGREIGKVTTLKSPVPPEKRPAGHPNDEVSIDVQVDRNAQVYRTVTVHLTQQGLMGQMVIDFVQGDAASGLADNHTEFVGERVPDISEAVADNMKRLTGPDSDLALTIKNAKTFMETLNNSQIPQVIKNTAQFTDTLKKEPWRLMWPSTKSYPGDEKTTPPKKNEHEATPPRGGQVPVAG
jgi:ABC-type transporter Mla subunit MlaD